MTFDFSKNKYLYGILLITSAILVSIILIFAIIRPSYLSNQKISVEIKKKKDELQVLEAKLTKLKDLKNEEAKLLKEKEMLAQALPEKKDVAGLFVQFERLVSSNASSVISADTQTITSSTGEQASSKGGINTHNYTIKLTTSTYSSLRNIIEASEKALRLANISDIGIVEKGNSFDVNLTVRTYSRMEDTNEAKD